MAADMPSEPTTPIKDVSKVPAGECAALIAGILQKHDVIFAAGNEPRAAMIANALASLVPEADIAYCPASDALPGDRAPASPANVGQRVAALRRVRRNRTNGDGRRVALVTTGEALAHVYALPEAFDAVPPRVAKGEKLALGQLFEQLVDAGYVEDDRVDEPGEVALRGHVLDVYPADADQPLRIEVGEGRVVSLRGYDPRSQRSTEERDAEELGRVAEPVISGTGATLIDHLPGAALIVEPSAEQRRIRFLELVADVTRSSPKRALRAVIIDERWKEAIADRPRQQLSRQSEPPPPFIQGKAPWRAFLKLARATLDGKGRLLLVGGARDLRFLNRRARDALKHETSNVTSWHEVLGSPAGSLLWMAAPIDRGFCIANIVAVAAADLLGSKAEREGCDASVSDPALFDLEEVRIGDVVVHEDHGIGIVAGLDRMPPVGDADSGDAIVLRYAGDAQRLVPVAEAERLWRYGGDGDAVSLDKLDGSTWEKRRGAVHAAVAETARSLAAASEDRNKRSAPRLDPDFAAYERFVAGFPFVATRDQERAIAAVRSDLASGRPMDRLVIGDVGFGKTEVALRAAALAALSGRQVAVAAPTTVLARQHLETFIARFAGSGIEVAGLSRLSSASEKKRVKAGLADGSIRIVVGTGAVAGRGVSYKALTLVIVDEEQRFGAADKARLRDLGGHHVLTLSATPIPRTLQAALVGVQRMSVIATPPARRQPIRTAMGTFDKKMVRAALMRERGRDGQSFVVVPRIDDMALLANLLEELVPELEIVQAHGKMPAAKIDEAMVSFGRGDGDILLATNIIEAGLDVPRANTMVIWRADRFGLSQLHQLRGRVGRGNRRGQILLLTEPDKEIAPRTLKRLRTLEAFDRLGAGFAISAQDLDMRGAGDLLGEAQAGHMKLIGIDLYQHLLESAIRQANGEVVARWTPELHLGIAGRLPDDWIPDVELRITFYMRLARADDETALDALEVEMEDRFGSIPEEAAAMLAIARIRANAKTIGISRVDSGPAAIAFTPKSGLEVKRDVADFVRKGDRLLLNERIEDPLSRLARIKDVLADFDTA